MERKRIKFEEQEKYRKKFLNFIIQLKDYMNL